ncbi:O-antigen ligase family protein [Parabacteroides sp.]|uniref:O-antigen ligase family protein n=1 Tax=Parabacteroides sp. TaxID=1869337 RepID=UPI00257AFFF2|nr:O-antigen ligase family protein [Parabacteroides sp.]
MKPWFFWNGTTAILYALILLFISVRLPFIKKTLKRKQFILCCLCLLMYSSVDLLDLTSLSYIIRYFFRHLLLVLFAILLSDKEKGDLVRLFTKVYSIILFVSILAYIFYLLDISMPYMLIKYEINTGYPSFRNYIFLIVRNEMEFFSRFQSIFLEPGHVGMVSSLLLYINRYDLKRIPVFIVFMSVLLSFSLAAYVLLVLGMTLYYLLKSKHYFRRLLRVSFLLCSVVVFSIVFYVNNPESVYSKLVVSRLDYDEERGISGNNRTSNQFDYYYDKVFFVKNDALFGIGDEEFAERFGSGNSSYKTFIVQNGIISLIFLFFLYCMLVRFYLSSIYVGLIILYIASFLQRPYALWEVELFLFMSAGSILKYKCNDKLFDCYPT